MKNLKYIALAILLGINLVSCTPDDSVQENETLHTEVSFTKGEDQILEEDDN
ncbi:hypothetical protein [Aquimarina pacifica]|uniref:hypothetical protein n=1 Tax=Aquimarina pacifica TaxID=1296415 RepID=UPI0004BC6ABA|nr:hypothetical protein [Aquimarina pacifica]